MNALVHTLKTRRPFGQHFPYFKDNQYEIEYQVLDDHIDILSACIHGDGGQITVAQFLHREMADFYRAELLENSRKQIDHARRVATNTTLMDTAMTWIIKADGGYKNDPEPCKFGISASRYPRHDIARLTIEEARELHRLDLFEPYLCGLLPAAVGIALFDSLTQFNSRTAVQILQHSVGATADGIVGPATIEKARHQNAMLTVKFMLLRRLDLYDAMVKSDSRQACNLEQWRGRVLALLEFLVLVQSAGI